jgi:AcrR family transcriptional regulator
MRSQIMDAVARQIEAGAGDFTFRALALASGVPERTLYRRFPSKELLLAEFWNWLNRERLALPPAPRSVDELMAQIPTLFTAFDRSEPLVRAMLRDPGTQALRLANADARLAEMGAALAAATRGIPPGMRRKVVACARLLTSAAGWATFKDLGMLTGVEAAAAAQWSLRALLAAIETPKLAARRR